MTTLSAKNGFSALRHDNNALISQLSPADVEGAELQGTFSSLVLLASSWSIVGWICSIHLYVFVLTGEDFFKELFADDLSSLEQHIEKSAASALDREKKITDFKALFVKSEAEMLRFRNEQKALHKLITVQGDLATVEHRKAKEAQVKVSQLRVIVWLQMFLTRFDV